MFIASLRRNLKWCYAPCREALVQTQTLRPLENRGGWRPGLFIIRKTCGAGAERGQTVPGTDPRCLFYTLLGRLVERSLPASRQQRNKYSTNTEQDQLMSPTGLDSKPAAEGTLTGLMYIFDFYSSTCIWKPLVVSQFKILLKKHTMSF